MAAGDGARAATARLIAAFETLKHRAVQGMLIVASLACLLLGGPPAPASAAEAAQLKASTSREARLDAVKSIPLNKLDPEARRAVSAVVNKPTIFRRLPVQVIDCDPELYQFLVRNPEVVIGIWDVMGISNIAMQRRDDTSYVADDGAGTTGTVQFVHSADDTHVIYSEGLYDGPMFPRPIRGRCVMVLKSGFVRETNGRHYVTSRIDTFIQLDNTGLELLAKTFQPLVGRLADYNFTETAGFLASLSRTAEVNGPGVQRLAAKLTNVEPATRQQFAALAASVGQKSAATGTADISSSASVKAASMVETVQPASRR